MAWKDLPPCICNRLNDALTMTAINRMPIVQVNYFVGVLFIRASKNREREQQYLYRL